MNLRELQTTAVAKLEERPRLKGISVLPAMKGNLGALIKQKVSQGLGACIIVEPATFDIGYDRDNPVLELTQDIGVFKNALLAKGTPLMAEDMVSEILFALRPSSGVKVTPRSGELLDDTSQVVRYVIHCTGKITLREEDPS